MLNLIYSIYLFMPRQCAECPCGVWLHVTMMVLQTSDAILGAPSLVFLIKLSQGRLIYLGHLLYCRLLLYLWHFLYLRHLHYLGHLLDTGHLLYIRHLLYLRHFRFILLAATSLVGNLCHQGSLFQVLCQATTWNQILSLWLRQKCSQTKYNVFWVSITDCFLTLS